MTDLAVTPVESSSRRVTHWGRAAVAIFAVAVLLALSFTLGRASSGNASSGHTPTSTVVAPAVAVPGGAPMAAAGPNLLDVCQPHVPC